MKNKIQEQIKQEIKANTEGSQSVETLPKDYLLYKSLMPELTVEMFIEHELDIKEMFEYDPCDYNNY